MTFKQFMAFPLGATVAYLTWWLAEQTAENGSLMAFFGLLSFPAEASTLRSSSSRSISS